jgi:hypothetical protein
MGKKEDQLLIGLSVVISISIIIWCLMGKSTYRCRMQQDNYIYSSGEFTGNSPNYNTSPQSYKRFNASEPGDTAFPFGERCPNSVVCPHNARQLGVSLCNQGNIL